MNIWALDDKQVKKLLSRITYHRPGESVACVVDKNSVESLVQVIYEISFKGYGRGYSILLLLNVSVVVTSLF